MLSRTSEYALRGLIYLAQHVEECPISGKNIAAEAGIPPKYLSKVLGDLVRAGVLESSRGIGGGFRLSRPAKAISLIEVLTPFEQFHLRRCPFGSATCGEDNPCLAHDKWKRVIDAEQRFFCKTSLHDVAIHRSRTKRKKKR